MKTLADEIIKGECKKTSENDLTNNTDFRNTRRLMTNKTKPKSAGNKSFRNHNKMKFMKTIERSTMGKENKLQSHERFTNNTLHIDNLNQ